MWVYRKTVQYFGKISTQTKGTFQRENFPAFHRVTSWREKGLRERKKKENMRRYLIRCYYRNVNTQNHEHTNEATHTLHSEKIFIFMLFSCVDFCLLISRFIHHSNLTSIWILRRKKQEKFNWQLKGKPSFCALVSTRRFADAQLMLWSNGAMKTGQKLIMRASLKVLSNGTSATFCFVMIINTFENEFLISRNYWVLILWEGLWVMWFEGR